MNKNLPWYAGIIFSFIAFGVSVFALWSVYDLRYKNISTPNQSTDIFYPPNPPIGADSGPDKREQLHQIIPPIQSDPFSGEPVRIPIDTPTGNANGAPPLSFLSGTTSQFISGGGASDINKLVPADVIIAYIGDSLMYYNTTMGFKFGLPSSNKTLRLDETGVYSRKSDAVLWLWFTKNFDIAVATFFVTPNAASSIETLSFDYNFIGYPTYMGIISRATTTVSNHPALEEVVSYESSSPGYPNIWKFVHILHNGNLYTFGAQIGPLQAVNTDEVSRMIFEFENSFRFLQ